ncbi:MAG: 5-deoxy-glucuronate isomerase [Anaerolineaceae bacterium]|nr:5-deoxy-glucuronate isomerase [Anaerolineaceae bacterium]
MYESLKSENRLDDTFVIQNGDTMVLPRGYHPLTLAPEYQSFIFLPWRVRSVNTAPGVMILSVSGFVPMNQY